MSLVRDVTERDLLALKEYMETTFFASTGSLEIPHEAVTTPGGMGNDWCYLQSTDLLYFIGTYYGSDSAYNGNWLVAIDPRLEDFSQTRMLSVSGNPITGLIPGQYNPLTTEQRLYGYNDLLANNVIREFDPLSLIQLSPDAYNATDLHSDGPAGPTTAPNAWGQQAAGTAAQHRWLIFEGLTDGVPGETDSIDTDAYPNGLMLAMNVERISHVSNQDFNGCMCWVDLFDGNCVGILRDAAGDPFPGESSHDTAIAGSQPRMGDGDVVGWSHGQFIPDPGTQLNQPKGELILTSLYDATNDFGSPLFAGAWIRIVDFNPFEVTIGQARTHGRIVLDTRVSYQLAPIISGGPTLTGGQGSRQILYVPPDDRFVHIFGDTTGTEPTALRHVYNNWKREVELAAISTPTPESSVHTADSVQYSCRVVGDVGDPAEGVEVTFATKRLSTVGEVLANTDPTYCANVPIDGNGTAAEHLAITVYEDSGGGPAALTLGVDYNITDFTTGEVDFLGSHPNGGSVYTIDYQHLDAAASPGRGTIATPTVTTDSDGVARALVVYSDTAAFEYEFEEVSVSASNS